MLAEAVWQTGTTGRYPSFQKASAHLADVRLGILANASASAMAPLGPPLPIELFLRLWCRVARMVKHGERHHELIQGSIEVVAGGALEIRDIGAGQYFAELLDGGERERASPI